MIDRMIGLHFQHRALALFKQRLLPAYIRSIALDPEKAA
jgi:hypothetical protein